MEDGREVVAKVPNPNSGIPHFTMASEFATTDFVGLFETRSTPNLANATGLGGSQKSSTHQHVMSRYGTRKQSHILLGLNLLSWLKLRVSRCPKSGARCKYTRGLKLFLPWQVCESNGSAFHSHITVACTTLETCSSQQATTMSRMAWPSKIQSLLLAPLLVGIGLMRADQFWILKEDHVRQSLYFLSLSCWRVRRGFSNAVPASRRNAGD